MLWIIQSFVAPETYAPVLLRRRAEKLSKITGKEYVSKADAALPRKTLSGQLKVTLSRPWALLFKEPIVFLTSIYMAIIYGTLYLCFAAFPIVFQSPYPEGWGWKPGVGGLSFVGIAIGMMASTIGSILDNKRYARVAAKCGGLAPPEARLPPALAGAVLLPIGLFWFAWTNGTNVHWVVPIMGSAVFASGLVLVFLSLMNYLIDSCKFLFFCAQRHGLDEIKHILTHYEDVIYAASVLAASAVLRSLFGAVFPLFTTYMYKDLGVHWASSIPAFLALACMPFPFLFYKYGEKIRLKCKYSAEASQILQKMMAKQQPVQEDEAVTEGEEGEKGTEKESENGNVKETATTEVK